MRKIMIPVPGENKILKMASSVLEQREQCVSSGRPHLLPCRPRDAGFQPFSAALKEVHAEYHRGQQQRCKSEGSVAEQKPQI